MTTDYIDTALELIREHGKIDTGTLAMLLDVNRTELFNALNDEFISGTVIRQTVYVDNGTPRSTLCFGWSCPAAH